MKNEPIIGGIEAHVRLRRQAELFKERNAVYKDNFRMVGRVMKAMFPDTRPTMDTEEDYNRWHLFELAIVKLTRYATHYNVGGHEESINDMNVYLAMVAELDAEARNLEALALVAPRAPEAPPNSHIDDPSDRVQPQERIASGHELYLPTDFAADDPADTARLVIEGGFSICKNCGASESELDDWPTCEAFKNRGSELEAFHQLDHDDLRDEEIPFPLKG